MAMTRLSGGVSFRVARRGVTAPRMHITRPCIRRSRPGPANFAGSSQYGPVAAPVTASSERPVPIRVSPAFRLLAEREELHAEPGAQEIMHPPAQRLGWQKPSVTLQQGRPAGKVLRQFSGSHAIQEAPPPNRPELRDTKQKDEGGRNCSSFRKFFARSEGCRHGLETTHNPKVAGSNPAPATMNDEGLADAETADPFRLPRLHPGIGSWSGSNA